MADNKKAEEVVEEKKEEATVEAKETKKESKNKERDKLIKLEKKYQEQIAKLEEDNKNLKNEYLKVFAEMENTKKRLKEEAIRDRKYASQKVVGELVQPIDMLMMIVNSPAISPEVANYQMGFKMIANQLVDILKGEGLALIESENKEFNPAVMQAVQTEWDEQKPENVVLKVMQQGYMYKDRVLRPAMVVVNKKPVENNEEIKEEEVK